MEPLENYDKLCKIGQGTYGAVFRAVHRTTGQMVALKRFKLNELREGIPNSCLREMSTLMRLKHPNVIKLSPQFKGNVYLALSRFYLVLELMDYDLRRLIADAQGKRFHPQLVKNIMWQLVQGVAFCHLNRIWHRDIKPQNLLMDRTGRLKLADFGLARFSHFRKENYTNHVVTLWYRAPELLLGEKQYAGHVDIWSVGCVFYEVVTLHTLFAGNSEIDQLAKMFQLLGTPDDSVWPGVSNKLRSVQFPKLKPKDPSSFVSSAMPENGEDLLFKMLTYCPERRIKAKTAISHVYFRDIDVTNVAQFMPPDKSNGGTQNG